MEAEQQAEEKQAARWTRKHEKLLDPVVDNQTVRPVDRVLDAGGSKINRLRRLGAFATGEDDVVRYDEGGRFVPLIGQPQEFDLKRVEVAAMVNHVLSFLEDSQRDLLLAYYVEGVNWKDLRRGNESRQAVHERLAWARNAFHKAFIAHAEDDINIKESDL